eukprot:1158331-Pelagomonas_calceolata.AAC.4
MKAAGASAFSMAEKVACHRASVMAFSSQMGWQCFQYARPGACSLPGLCAWTLSVPVRSVCKACVSAALKACASARPAYLHVHRAKLPP